MSETVLTSLHEAREQVAHVYEQVGEPAPLTLEQPRSSEHAERLDLDEEVTPGALWDAVEAEQQAAEEKRRAEALSHEQELKLSVERMSDEQIRDYFAQLTQSQAAIRSSFTLAA